MSKLKDLTKTEPVRIGEALTSLLAVAAMLFEFVDVNAGIAVIAAVIGIYEVVRSQVWSPASVEALTE